MARSDLRGFWGLRLAERKPTVAAPVETCAERGPGPLACTRWLFATSVLQFVSLAQHLGHLRCRMRGRRGALLDWCSGFFIGATLRRVDGFVAGAALVQTQSGADFITGAALWKC